MKRIIIGLIASITTLGLVAACSDNLKSAKPTPTVSPGLSVASDLTIPSVGSIPTDFSIPAAFVDQIIAQFEASGVKVDRACFDNLLKDDTLRKAIGAGGTPSAEVIQKFAACFKP